MAELLAINQSQVKSWRRCQKEWDYKYRLHLVPRQKQLPLYKGSWGHAALETHYKRGDWRIGYNKYLAEYNKLFEEQKAELNKRGNLPDAVKRIIQSYLWYAKRDNWEVVLVEKTFDITFRGVRIKGTIDLVIRDKDTGYTWMIDHKFVGSIPQASAFHAMDPQLMLYPWAAKKAWGLEITGVMWNYVKSKPPTLPRINKDGSVSKRKIVTDYPTAYKFLKANDYDPKDYSEYLKPLMKSSPFIRRYRRPREKGVTSQIILEYLKSAREIQDHDGVVRNITRDCPQCAYQSPCQAELNGMDSSPILRKYFVEEDTTEKHGEYDAAEFEGDDEEE